jgi:predicted nucleotidyltransferase component of viral defense system
VVAKSALAQRVTFGGATALSAVYLHHRRSHDLDFFSLEPLESVEVLTATRGLARPGLKLELRTTPVRQMLILVSKGREIGHIDFAHYPYDPIDRVTRWRGLRVDSLIDLTVNKVQAVLTRARDRDFVDLYFLLREGPKRDLEKLLSLARTKFDAGPGTITFAECLLRAETIAELPDMLRPVTLDELRSFFSDLSRSLVRRGPR